MSLWPAGALELASAQRVAHLATCGADGVPHAVPICFVIIDEHLYSIVDNKPKKRPLRLKRLRNVIENPRAAVVIDDYDEDWERLAYVLLRGRAVIVDGEPEYRAGLEALLAKYRQYRSMALERAVNPLLRLDIESVHYWAAARST